MAISILTAPMDCSDEELLPHCIALAGLVGAIPDDGAQRRLIVDCAIAYGCGWRRTLRDTGDCGVNGLWESAFRLLVGQITAAIMVANDRLGAILTPLLQDPNEISAMDDLRESRWVIASTLAFRLIKPLHSRHESAENLFAIAGNRDINGAPIAEDAPRRDFTRVQGQGYSLIPLPAGSRYIFDVMSGNAVAVSEARVLAAGPGGRIVIRAGDFATVEVAFPVDANLSRFLRLNSGREALVRAAVGPVSLAQWECGCGSWACAERHRLASWVPDPKLGLKDFVNSAINGRDFPLKPKALIAAMYYSYLSREGWGGSPGPDSAGLPRIRRVLMVRVTTAINPTTGQVEEKQDLRENFLLLSAYGDFGPVRVVRCGRCGRFRHVEEVICDCGAEEPKGAPAAVWAPLPLFRPLAGPPPDGDPLVRGLMSEFLDRWMCLINTADPPGRSAERRRERETYQEVVEAFRRSDLVRAAELIEYARSQGWSVPEVEDDKDE
ncbi:hypothetical protein [Paludibaculum fermentans]|uniref:hypothetical protein n=1 Tax=Paludibaculum fermentans TaxID=1473598 RepID=UPI003EB9A9AA